MKSHVKIGLTSGVIAFVPALCASFAVGICGPTVTLVSGAGAGFFTGRHVKTGVPKKEGARLGAISGAISGAIAAAGQLMGVAATLVYFQVTGTPTPLGTLSPPAGDPAAQTGFYFGGLAVGLCFAGVGLALAALAGGGVAFLVTPAESGKLYD
jgi:hypothetical protein